MTRAELSQPQVVTIDGLQGQCRRWRLTTGGALEPEPRMGETVEQTITIDAPPRAWRVEETVGVGVEAGVVTGYGRLLPLAYPYVRIGRGRWALKVLVLPTKDPVIGLQVVRR